jgi:hypothetical protein
MVTETRKTEAAVGAGSMAEALGGAGAVVLGILGLVHIVPRTMASIATIVVGCALVFEAASIASRHSHLRVLAAGEGGAGASIGGGISAEMAGGLAGIVLGALGVAGFATRFVVPAAVIVFGVALLVGATQTARLERFHLSRIPATISSRAVQAGLGAASGASVLVGLGALVLGILALLQISTIVLSLIALLAVGVVVLLDGTATGAKAARAAA